MTPRNKETALTPRIETTEAAKWWASRLGNAYHDIGDRDDDERALSSDANLMTALAGRTFTDEQRDAFQAAAGQVIEEHLQRWETGIWEGGWDPAEPLRGSANRAIGCDYNPDQVLQDAGARAGIEVRMLDLPMKTVMWINPGEVKVAEGYGVLPVTVWKAQS
jgi:hypothetical protein